MRETVTGKVPAGNTQIPFAKIGDGPGNFVILPGLSIRPVTLLAEAVAKQYAAIPEEYTIWLFDRPEELPEQASLKEMAEQTAEAMKKLDISAAAVFGASQGGMLAMFLTAAHPELVRKLMLGSTASFLPELFRERLSCWKRMTETKDHRGLTESFVDWMYGPEVLRLYRESLLKEIPQYSEQELKHFAALLASFDTPDLEKQPAGIHCPALVLTSLGDRVFGPEPGRRIAEELNAKLYEYSPEYGHAVYDEAPDYAERIVKFIKENE